MLLYFKFRNVKEFKRVIGLSSKSKSLVSSNGLVLVPLVLVLRSLHLQKTSWFDCAVPFHFGAFHNQNALFISQTVSVRTCARCKAYRSYSGCSCKKQIQTQPVRFELYEVHTR